MKRFLHKSVSLLLAAVISMSLVVSSFAAERAAGIDIPTIYIAGQGYHLQADKTNPNSDTIYPLSFEFSYIGEVIKELNPVFAKAYITGDYDKYCDVICDAVDPIFAKIRLDNNGEVTDNSGCTWTWTRESLANTHNSSNGNYALSSFNFVYDWRLDPCVTADTLNAYINDIIAVTGAQKVNIVARCLGCNIAAAYLTEYGSSLVNKCLFYCGTLEGTAVCSKTFSGQICIDPDAVERFVYDLTLEKTIQDMVEASVSLLNKTYGLNLLSNFVDSIYQKVKADIVPRLLIETFATFPSYWSMIGKEDYETAKSLVFGENNAEYAGLISKIDNYHYNVQNDIRTTLLNADATGTGIINISKYGYQLTPVVPNVDDIADGIVELSLASLGATASSVNTTLSDEYITAAKANGTFKYISSDLQVDASTCLFPDNTWIVKGIEHKNFPSSIDELICAALNYDGNMTVFDDARFPQYLVFDDESGSIAPMSTENDDVENWEDNSFFTILGNFFKALYNVIKQYLIPLIKEKMTTPAQ